MAHDAIWPQRFSTGRVAASPDELSDPTIRRIIEFFEAKGLAALKHEDSREQWYDDWIACQARHQLYASVLSPKLFSSCGRELDLLRLARVLETLAFFSPAHGYSLQVSFLGLFAILMGTNDALKREAVAMLEAGGLFALGVSERDHGADLLGNEFTVRGRDTDGFVASGSKYYIGNANCAAMMPVLAREQEVDGNGSRRPRFVLFALRPSRDGAIRNLRKIRTSGVRAAFVGGFDVSEYEFGDADVIARGRDAWDAVLGTVTLGKFFLGFGAIGICEHALAEAAGHVTRRLLYGRSVIDMPHIGLAMAQAYARLTAMKLYAYRALDYVHAATAADRRHLLFCAVQKAKVSTEGVRVVALISECVGAKGFESGTFIETALRDAQLIPGLEGSAHINLAFAAQFIPQYLDGDDERLTGPESLVAGGAARGENPYLVTARTGNINQVRFPPFLRAFEPLSGIANARLLTRQARTFHRAVARGRLNDARAGDTSIAMALGQCVATFAYAQLIAENVVRLEIAPAMTSVVMGLLVGDLSDAAMKLASLAAVDCGDRRTIRRMITVPRTSAAEWAFVSSRLADHARDRPTA